jgi:hypothetical protein
MTIQIEDPTIQIFPTGGQVNLNFFGSQNKADDVNHINFYRSRGTVEDPVSLINQDDLYNIRGYGYDGIAYGLSTEFAAVPNEEWTPTGHGSEYQLFVTARGTAGPLIEIVRLSEVGIQSIRGNYYNSIPGCGLILTSACESATSNNILMKKARGNYDYPEPVMLNDLLGQIFFEGYDGAKYVQTAGIIAGADQNFEDNANGTHLAFYSTPIDGHESKISLLLTPNQARFGNFGNIVLGTQTNNSEVKYVASNAMWNGNEYVYALNGCASIVVFSYGGMSLYSAPYGTGGTSAAFTERLSVDIDGNVKIPSLAGDGTRPVSVNHLGVLVT